VTLDPATLPSLLGYGFALGWSVAWPPGPINAEIVRRGLARGFWPAYSLLLGACLGDASWAVLVALGAGVVFAGAWMHLALGIVSTALLLALAFIYLRGAWHGFSLWRAGRTPAPPRGLDSRRASFLLGLTMALTGPWNMAFWLAVIGRPETLQLGLAGSLVVAVAVILGALAWGLSLTFAVVVLRLRFASAAWELFAKGATGLLMLFFAARSIQRLIAG
jgi:threonine/homoserine/homoserine lactone efflux protein